MCAVKLFNKPATFMFASCYKEYKFYFAEAQQAFFNLFHFYFL